MELDALWRDRGINLAEAPDRLVPVRQFSLARPPAPKGDSELTGGWKSLASVKGWDKEQQLSIKKGLDAAEHLANSVMAVGSYNYERSRFIANLVIAKKALAIGFAKGKSEPEIVPFYLFQNDSFIKWSKNEIQGNDLRFVSVRIVKLGRSEIFAPKTKEGIQKGRSKVGRPSSVELEGIIRELNRDSEFSKKPGKTQVTAIRKRAMDKYPAKFKNGRGLSTPTIYRFMRMVSAS